MCIESFLRYIRYEKNYSSHTVLSYRNDLLQFEAYYVECKAEKFSPESVDLDLVRDWVVCLVEKGVSPRSVSRKVSALRSFFKFLVKKGIISVTPIRNIQLPKMRKSLPAFLKEEEMDLLLDGIDFGNDFRGVRDRLIINMFYSTGIRRGELIGLKDADVDISMSVMKVTGKRNKQRIIPFGEELRIQIEQYRNARDGNVGGECEFFFIKEDCKPLYPELVYRIVTRYLNMVSTLTKKSPHVLRHTFASAMLNNGAELNSIKELLGHGSLASTEVYTHITFEELKQSYKQAHPRAEKKEGVMKISIQSIHFDASTQLESFIQKKVAKLGQYCDDIMSAEVVLKVVKPETAQNKEASIKLLVPKSDDIFSSKVADTFEEAVDVAVDALVKQLQKMKEKMRAK